MEALGYINHTASASQRQQQQSKQEAVSLLSLRIGIIKVQLLQYLANRDRCKLFDSCWYLRPLKQTEFNYYFSKIASLKYATDAVFRELVHRSAAINEQRSGKRMIHVNLCNRNDTNYEKYDGHYDYDTSEVIAIRQESTDFSILSEVIALDLSYCNGVVDVTALGDAQMLNLEGCYGIANVDALIRRLIAVLNTTTDSGAVAPTDVDRIDAEQVLYAKKCAIFTLGSLAADGWMKQDLIVAEGGMAALIAMLRDDSDGSSSEAIKYEAASVLVQLSTRNERTAKSLFTTLIATLNEVSDRNNAAAKKWAAYVLGRCAIPRYIEIDDGYENSQDLIAADSGITALIVLLNDTSDNSQDLIAAEGGITALIAALATDSSNQSSTEVKMEAARALGNLADENKSNQELTAAEGGITALLAVLRDDTSEQSSWIAKESTAKALGCLAKGNTRNQDLIVVKGDITALIAVLKDESDSNINSSEAAKEQAVDALVKLTRNNERNAECLVHALIAVLNDRCCATARQWAAHALNCLSIDDRSNKQLILVYDGIIALLAVLKDTSDRSSIAAKGWTAKALGHLAEGNKSIQDLIAAEGGITALVAVRRGDTSDESSSVAAKRQVANALVQLARNNENNAACEVPAVITVLIMEALGNNNNAGSAVLQQQQPVQKQEALLTLRIEVIKLQLLPYLDNDDRRNLFDSCWFIRPLKQTEFTYKFSKTASVRYATDAVFRELVHCTVAINELKSEKRMIEINLSDNQDIVNVSMLGEVMKLDLSDCRGVTNVTALGKGQLLELEGCRNIANLDTFIRRLIVVLNTRNSSAAASTDTTAENTINAKWCAAYTLAGLADANESNQDLIAAEGGITALIAVVIDEYNCSCSDLAKEEAVSTLGFLASNNENNTTCIVPALIALPNDTSNRCNPGAKMEAARALRNLATENESNKNLIATEGGITALVTTLGNESDHVLDEAARKQAVHALLQLVSNNERNLQSLIPALIALLENGSDHSRAAAAKQWTANILGRCAFCHFASDLRSERNQNLIAAEGGITALIAMLKNESDCKSALAKMEAANALSILADRNESNQDLIVAEGGITTLITMLKDESDRSSEVAKKKAALALAQLARSNESNTPCIVSTLLATLKGVPERSSATATQWAAHTLAGCASYNHAFQSLISAEDVITALIGVLRDDTFPSSCSEAVKEEAALSLFSLSVRDESYEACLFPALIALLTGIPDHSSAVAKKWAARVLTRWAARWDCCNREIEQKRRRGARTMTTKRKVYRYNPSLIAAEGGITALISVLTDTSDRSSAEAKGWAAIALGMLLDENPSGRQLLASEGGITALIAVLNDTSGRSSAEAKEIVTEALRSLANNNLRTRQLIITEGGMNALIAEDEADCITALIAELSDASDSSSSEAAKKNAADALVQLARNNNSNAQFLVPALIAVLNEVPDHSSAAAKQWVIHTLACCTDGDDSDDEDDVRDNQRLIAAVGGVTAFISVLTDTSNGCNAEAKEQAARALGNLVEYNRSITQLTIVEGGIATLLAVLNDTNHSSVEAKEWAATALENLAYDDEAVKDLIAAEGGINALIDVLNDTSNHSSVEAKVASTLRELADDNAKNRWLIITKGGMKALIFDEDKADRITALIAELFDDSYCSSSDAKKKEAATALKNLALKDKSIAECLFFALIAVLTGVSGHNSATAKQWAAYTLACCTDPVNEDDDADSDGEDKAFECNQRLIVAEGGITALIAVLNDDTSDPSSEKAKEWAVRALGNLADGNEINQNLIARKGGIRALIFVLKDDSTRSSVDTKNAASDALRNVAYAYQQNQQLIIAEGGITVLIALASQADFSISARGLLRILANNNADVEAQILSAGGEQFL